MITYSYEEVVSWKPEKIFEMKEKVEGWDLKPILTTLVIPTYDRGKNYRKSLKKTIKKTAELVDTGAVNEVLIMDGTGKKNNPDKEFNEFVLECASRYSDDFNNQIELIRKSPSSRTLAKRGEFPFRYKIFNQKNPEYYRIFIEDIGFKLDGNKISEKDIQQGKGNALKFSVPATKGDIICYNDSDIKTYEPFYVTGLLMPFFLKDKITFTKATYIRRNSVGELGGRIKRLVYQPWVNALVKRGKFAGLENLEYGTSGEFAIKRDLANKITFESGYKIETSLNTQVYHELYGNMNRVAQSHLGIFEHFSSDVEENRKTGRDKAMENMAREITEVWVEKTIETGLELSEGEFFDMYLEEVTPIIEDTKKMLDKSEIAKKFGIKYGEEQIELDLKRLERYKPQIKKGIKNAIESYEKNENTIPSWRYIKELCGLKIYEDFKEHLSKETTIYTLELLEGSDLI